MAKPISLALLNALFPDDAAAARWFEQARWPNGPACPYCGSLNVQAGVRHHAMTHRCRDCPERRFFSLRSRTAMEGSKLGYRVWAIAVFLLTTNPKGFPSTRLADYLGVTQKTAWYLAHRIRAGFEAEERVKFAGPVEIDETIIGGRAKNMHAVDRRRRRANNFGKVSVLGVRDRATNRVRARVVEAVDKPTARTLVQQTCEHDAMVYSDEANAFKSLRYHRHVNHSAGQYVTGYGVIHTNGIESFWSLLKRGYIGVYHWMSPQHLHRYVSEFTGRHNLRGLDTLAKMAAVVRGLEGKRLRYADLVS